jgi:clan AA aspartic protease
METIHVTLKVKNISDPTKEVSDRFLVDSGADFTVLPEGLVKRLKIKPIAEEEFELADGNIVKRKVGNALIEYDGREAACLVILGEKDDAKILGTLTLESLGLRLDPLKRRLYKARLRM